MKRQSFNAPALAWGIWIFSLLVGAGAIAVTIFYTGLRGITWEDTVVATVFPTMGAVIISHRGSHPVGWMFLGAGVTSQINVFTTAYAFAVFVKDAPLPFGLAAAWLATWTWAPGLALLILFIPQVFPTGRFFSPRWRIFGRACIVWAAAGITLVSLLPFSESDLGLGGAHNPLGVTAIKTHLTMLALIFGPGTLVAFGLSIASLVVRFRRSRGEEAQQMKWFVYSMCFFGVMIVLASTIGWDWLTMVGLLANIAALSVALLRYRLYEIDRIINRTAVYLVVTGGLAGAYFGIVLLLQLLLPVDSRSPLIVAVSTLAVAAAFRPVRSRVQTVVDLRFNRARYDASRTLERFAGRLRSEVDLDSLGGGLVQTVADTMQPTAVSLWLKEEAG